MGSFACCDDVADVFNISPAATVLAQVPLNYLPPSSASSSSLPSTSVSATFTFSTSASASANVSSPAPIASAPASQTSTIAPASQTSTIPLPSSTSSSNVAAIGAGVGIPCGIIAVGLFGFLLWKRKRAEKPKARQLPDIDEADVGYPAQGVWQNGQGGSPDAQGYTTTEIGAAYTGGNLGEAGGIGIRDMKGYFAPPPPRELEAESTVHELDGGNG